MGTGLRQDVVQVVADTDEGESFVEEFLDARCAKEKHAQRHVVLLGGGDYGFGRTRGGEREDVGGVGGWECYSAGLVNGNGKGAMDDLPGAGAVASRGGDKRHGSRWLNTLACGKVGRGRDGHH